MQKSVDVVILEDEADLRELLTKALVREGLKVSAFESGIELLKEYNELDPSMMIVDRRMPAMDGLDVIRAVRKGNSKVRIMVLSALGSPEEIVEGLEAGADDYIKKTTSMMEISARILFTLKKIKKTEEQLFLDIETREVYDEKNRVKLTGREFEIFEQLFKQPGIAVLTESLIEILSQKAAIEASNLPVHIHSLRKKLSDFGLEIESLRGIGYRLNRKGAA